MARTGVAVKTVLVAGVGPAFVFAGLLSCLMGFVNSLQIIMHLPLMAVNLPVNVMDFHKLLLPVA